jgi:hypothetical protein
MPARKSEMKSRLALLAALAALVAAAVLQLAPRQGDRSVEAASVARPPAAAPAAVVPVASDVPAAPSKPAPRRAAGLQGEGMRAYIDPDTGQLREAEQEELAPPSAERAARVAGTEEVQSSEAPDLNFPLGAGGVGRPVDDSTMVYTVATIGPDGTLRVEHAQGGATARKKVAAGSKSRRPAGQEASNDR